MRRPGNPFSTLAIAAAVIAALAVLWVVIPTPNHFKPSPTPAPVRTMAPPRATPPFRAMVYPTSRTDLNYNGKGLQLTASGRPESGAYGSVRFGRFHEGVDIAAARRDRAGHPLDQVRAVAWGKVGYINRVAGNSNYGIYVVLLHDDPMGTIYTLYAHLSKLAPALSVGAPVEVGAVLGTMGNTPSSIIPMARGHLHFEIGLISNSRFREWFHSRRLKPDHGIFSGWNLLAIDPLAVIATHQRNHNFSFRDHLRTTPQAFEMVVATSKQLDFFRRYQDLWEGPLYLLGPVVITCSANGVPISGRNATPAEAKSLGRDKASVLSADASVLGGNGAKLVERNSRNSWKPGSHSRQWLEILTY